MNDGDYFGDLFPTLPSNLDDAEPSSSTTEVLRSDLNPAVIEGQDSGDLIGQECKDHSADNPPKVYPDNAEALLCERGTPSDVESRNPESEIHLVDPVEGVNPSPSPPDSPQKRYGHYGKRRRNFTEELFRCPAVDQVSKTDVVCNALLWKNKPQELRAHLRAHLSLDQINGMSDDEVRKWYVDARRIFLQGIPEDEMDDEEDEQE